MYKKTTAWLIDGFLDSAQALPVKGNTPPAEAICSTAQQLVPLESLS